MLYKLVKEPGQPDSLSPMEFKDVSSFDPGENREKNLENLLAESLFEVLYEDARLLPIHQERPRQSEADIYALNEKGELFIFELKRSDAGDPAVRQALGYAQDAGQWTYSAIEKKFRAYLESHPQLTTNQDKLSEAHKEAFELDQALVPRDFNKKQHLIVIGSASDETLIDAVGYWKNQGISIEFLPYRIYEIKGEHYFEFFALPFDRHTNPRATKGVLFDTNLAWNKDSIWDMMERKRVAAYGSRRHAVGCLNPNDIVFFSHKGFGIVAAAKVKTGKLKKPNDTDDGEWYRDVEFLTDVPKRKSGVITAMPFAKVVEITGKSFYWARINKVPYLSRTEAEHLVDELKKYLEGSV